MNKEKAKELANELFRVTGAIHIVLEYEIVDENYNVQHAEFYYFPYPSRQYNTFKERMNSRGYYKAE